MKATRILETCLYVDDLDAAEAFYRDVIGLEFYAKQEGRHVFFRCGTSMFLLFNPDATSDPTLPFGGHGCRGPGHAAFEIGANEVDAWRDYLISKGVQITSETDWPSGGHSLYFDDPSGNVLEVATRSTWIWP
ncbi:MAG TPA: VOC family protein [Candidatus Hydrogenedentes bacterium]|nr:VOC family protein [Candidatus Hydrogenedentota bacterium]